MSTNVTLTNVYMLIQLNITNTSLIYLFIYFQPYLNVFIPLTK